MNDLCKRCQERERVKGFIWCQECMDELKKVLEEDAI